MVSPSRQFVGCGCFTIWAASGGSKVAKIDKCHLLGKGLPPSGFQPFMPKRIVPVIQIDLAVRHAKMGNSKTVNVLLHHWQEVHSMFMHSNGCYPISLSPIKLVSSIWLDSPANQKKGQGSEAEVHLIYGDSPRIALCWLCYKRSKEVQCNEAKRRSKAMLLHPPTPR